MRSARTNLGYGMMLIALGAGLCQFVIIGLIGIIIMFIALYLLLKVVVFEYPEKELTLPSAICVKLLYIIGILSCMAVAFYTSAIAYNTAATAQRAIPIPFQMEWYIILIIGLIPYSLIFLALHYHKEWSFTECLVWGLAAYSTAPVSIVIFRVFLSFGFPVSA